MSIHNIEIAWLVAVMAPWTVSPHPNFSESEPSGPALLALVTEGRGQDRESKYGRLTTSRFATALIENAMMATHADTQDAGSIALENIAVDNTLPFAARTAAALFASVAFAESDQHTRGIDLLDTLLSEIRTLADGKSAYPSLQLCGAALGLQATQRNMEIRQFNAARSELAWVFAVLPRGAHSRYDRFPVSRGISWGSSRVQADIATLLKSNAAALEATLEDIRGGKWEGIVRGRSGWIAMRQRLQDGKRDEAMLNSLYEKQYEATSGKIRFGGVPVSTNAWNALLSAELTSTWSRVNSGREAYARILLLEGLNSPFNASEALRLLRHADSKDVLNVVLRQLRSSGPLEAIRNDMVSILDRRSATKYATASDLRVLQSSSELMSPDERGLAVEFVKYHLTTDDLFREAQWTKQERVLKTLSALLVGDSTDSLAAESALQVVAELQGEESDPAIQALIRFADSVAWREVAPRVRSKWLAWATATPEATEVPLTAKLTVGALVRGDKASAVEKDPLGNALNLITGNPTDQNDIDLAAQSLSTALSRQREEAVGGSRSFGGLDPFDLAAAFAVRFDDDTVWEQIAFHISEAALDASQLGRGLDRLALSTAALPKIVVDALSANGTRLLKLEPEYGFFSTPSVAPFPSAVRILSSESLLSDAEAMTAVIRMMSQGVLGRLEAAKCSSRIKTDRLSPWRLALLLQASFDSEPEIVAEAGLGLGANYDPKEPHNEHVADRIVELLATNGVTVPMRVMQGLYRNVQMVSIDPSAVLLAVKILGQNSVSRSVREGAMDLLEHLSSTNGQSLAPS